MKKHYSYFFFLIFGSLLYGQDLVITGIIDGPLPGGTPKVLELYVVNNISDMSIYGLESTTNGAAAAGAEFTFPADSYNAGDFIYVSTEQTNFNQYFGFDPDYVNSVINVNGDDTVILYQNGSVYDTYGEIGVDGTGEPWEHLDGWGYRKDGTGPNATFNPNEWTFSGPDALDGCDLDDDTGTNAGCASMFPIGTYSATGCGILFGAPVYNCSTTTPGNNNDSITIELGYSGSDSTITSVSVSAGTLGGDDPATVNDGTITISGISEGDSVTLTLNGGICDGQEVVIDVPADVCDPTPDTCFDLSLGPEQFEMVVVQPNSDGDEWMFDSGVYSMNGYCGSGCEENIDTWLIFGPLDMTGVNDLELAFSAVENFGETELLIRYTSSYSGCPGTTSWTTAATIVDSGVYSVDLSSATGSDVFIGVQYMDDGVDGYSDWDLANVELQAIGNCPSLGSRPTSGCATCDISLGAASYSCSSNTAGINNDGVTVTIPYSGSESNLSSVTTTSSGTIGGDNPATVADGQITITGLSEGDSWDIILNGGDCDGTSISGEVPSTLCDPVTCTNVGDIVITEIMQNPSINPDPAGEYFELYNTTASPVDLINWIIKDDVTESEIHQIRDNLIIPAGGYIVIGNSATPNGGLTLDYAYDNDIFLANGTDGIIIECSGTVIDQVIWDDGATFPDPTGASMELAIDALNATDNDLGSNWGTAQTPFGDGDLGTPGQVNDFTLSIENFEKNSFKIYPNPVSGNTLYIKGTTNGTINARIYDIIGKEVMNTEVKNHNIDISTLNTGLYIVKLTQGKATISRKLIVQ